MCRDTFLVAIMTQCGFVHAHLCTSTLKADQMHYFKSQSLELLKLNMKANSLKLGNRYKCNAMF